MYKCAYPWDFSLSCKKCASHEIEIYIHDIAVIFHCPKCDRQEEL